MMSDGNIVAEFVSNNEVRIDSAKCVTIGSNEVSLDDELRISIFFCRKLSVGGGEDVVVRFRVFCWSEEKNDLILERMVACARLFRFFFSLLLVLLLLFFLFLLLLVLYEDNVDSVLEIVEESENKDGEKHVESDEKAGDDDCLCWLGVVAGMLIVG